MQSAFGFREACPASGAAVFPRQYGAGAMGASDAGVVLVVQRVIGHVMLEDVVPDVLLGPVSQRVHLHQLEFVVPLNFACVGAGAALLAADGRDPGIEGG